MAKPARMASTKANAGAKGPTPMMQQYFALKREAEGCLLFYRMGDFFELFFDDARQAAAILDIALTSRGEHDGEPVAMCGVPVHAAEGYLARLIKAGCRVAIAEQTETPEQAKKRGGYKALVARTGQATLVMDEATRSSLEILQSQQGSRAGSLIAAVDRCVTGAGARQLADDLGAPLLDRPAIEARLALVHWLHDDPLLRADLREVLRALPDIGRALGRVVAGRGSPRDLGQIRDGLAEARRIRDFLIAKPDRPALLEHLLPAMGGHGALVDLMQRALVASPPTERAQGSFIAEGYDAALDELRAISGNARRAIATLESRYREDTGIAALKIKHNGVLGYFIEVPAKHGDILMAPDSGFTHRQTMAGAVRFNSLGLHEEASRIAEAGGHALAAEEAHFEELTAKVVEARLQIAETAAALARVDVAAGQAERAAEGGWCRPQISEDNALSITGGRHPVVEAALASAGAKSGAKSGSGERFVANDCNLAPDDRLWLIGGPNMGGKSTFLRQNALIVLLAQAGGYVPAENATVGLVDKLFSRVGASDNLARGRSTFMVEMVETAAILAQASERSFVILDEVGRGTSTYDGLALAWAVVEAVHSRNKSRCLFATHYHELSRLAESCEALSLHHVRAREWRGELVLLHELAEGPADRSYGLAVAKLAGVPKEVVARAKSVLDKLEKARSETGGLAAGLGDLPLFAAASAVPEAQKDPVRERLEALDVDALSPRDALEILYELKRRAGETEH